MDFNFEKVKEEDELPREEPIKPGVVSDTRKGGLTDDEQKNICIIRISEPLYLDLVSSELNMDKRLLQKMNPDYEMYVLKKYPTTYYYFHLPKDKIDEFLIS